LIFGRDKPEIFVKIEACNDRDSESSPLGIIDRGKSKKYAEKVSKYVIISIQYAINSKFSQEKGKGTVMKGSALSTPERNNQWASPLILGDFHRFDEKLSSYRPTGKDKLLI
jgi:hypothetical protein